MQPPQSTKNAPDSMKNGEKWYDIPNHSLIKTEYWDRAGGGGNMSSDW